MDAGVFLNNKDRSEIVRDKKFEFAQLPPQALDMEESVLGALMLDRASADTVMAFLKKKHFYKDAHQRIFKAIESLYQEKTVIDILSVTQKLKSDGSLSIVGGAYAISQLTNRVSSTANTEYHARIILQCFMSRQIISIGNNLVREGYDDSIDVFDKIETLNKGMLEMSSIISTRQATDFKQLVADAIAKSKTAKTSQVEPGVPIPFSSLSKIIGGWYGGKFIVVGARPAMGKTSFVLQCAWFASNNGFPTVVFSLEETALEFTYKILSALTNIPANRIKRGQLSELESQKVEAAQDKVNNNLIIHDDPNLCPREISALMRKHIAEDGSRMCVIDYVQMVKADEPKRNREEEVSSITRSFKNMAKELDIPVIVPASLSREVEKRAIKRPMLHDLRESGSIESDADMVLFLYRPEYYGIEQDEKKNSLKGLCEVEIAKHRGGPVGTIKLRFTDYLTKFEDWKKEEDIFNNGESDDLPF